MFDYEWLEEVLDKLADIYVQFDLAEHYHVAGAVQNFNERLAIDPLSLGESRDAGYRVAFIHNLVVTFHVNESIRRVRVTGVARFGR